MINKVILLSLFFLLVSIKPAALAAALKTEQACPFSTSAAGKAFPAVVDRVSDGDTIYVTFNQAKAMGKQAIRLLSLDTPELHFPFNGKWYDQGPIAEHAKVFVDRMLRPGDAVLIELDREVCDVHGRVLGYVWKGRTNINQVILENSMAVNYCIAPNLKYCRAFSAIVARTSAGKAGVFGVPGLMEPYLWRAKIRGTGPDKKVGDIRTGKVYPPSAVNKIPLAYRVFYIN